MCGCDFPTEGQICGHHREKIAQELRVIQEHRDSGRHGDAVIREAEAIAYYGAARVAAVRHELDALKGTK